MSEPEEEGPTAALAPRPPATPARPRPAPPPAPARPGAAAAARELAVGDVVDGRYRVTRRAGADDGGVAYEVEHARTGRTLSLRLAQGAGAAEALEREARAAGEAGRHALAVVDLGASTEGAWIVTELAPGQSLRALLDDTGQLPPEVSIEVALAVAEHLHEAHARGLVHRELRPDLVLLDDDPSAAFGVKVVGPRAARDGATAGPRPAAAPYLALEQLRGAADVDARADVYALGALVYECLAGRRPYAGASVGELVVAQCAGPPTDLSRLRPDVPAEACAVVMRALATRQEDRPATMLALATALAPFGEGWHGRWLRRHGVKATPAAKEVASAPELAAAATTGGDARGDRDTPTELYRGAPLTPLGAEEAKTAVMLEPHAPRAEPVVPFVPAAAPVPSPFAAPLAPAQLTPMQPAPVVTPSAPARDLPAWERAVDRALGDLGDAIARASGRNVAVFEAPSRGTKLALVASLAFTVVGLSLLLLALLR